jgi:predicted small secreted protein
MALMTGTVKRIEWRSIMIKSAMSTVRVFAFGILCGASLCFVLSMLGCNTIAGFADDVKAVSKGTQEWLVSQQEK